MRAIVSRLVPDRFILALIVTVVLASIAPARGVFANGVNILTTAAIVLLFFLHGVRLSREAVIDALGHWRLHLTILAATFVLFPLLGLALASAIPAALPPPLWIGVLFLCALPSTVQSSIAFTSIARGNIAGAVAAAALSNLLGVLVTPLLMGLIANVHGGGIQLSGIGKLILELFLPFVAGHLSRPWLGSWVARHRRLLTVTDRGTVVLAVYSAFSAAVIGGIWHEIDSGQLAVLIGLSAVILALVLLATYHSARALGFGREDRITITFVGSKKSLASGVPIARVLFAGPAMGSAVLPMMIFHQMQLMVCAWLARRWGEHKTVAE